MSGRVLRGTAADSVPAAGLRVVLHRVGREGGGGPVDSGRTNAAGRYTLRHARRDTNAIYLVSATWRDITYFSEGILPDGAADSAAPLVVFDTSSTAPPIGVAERHIVVRLPDADGSRRVLELLELANRGALTRIARDSVTPVWSGLLPAGAVQFEAAESDVSAEAVSARGDTVVVTAPIPPGRKQVLYTYVLPAGREDLTLRPAQRHERLTVLLEDTTAVQVAGDLEPRGIQVFEDAQFAMWQGGVPAGTEIAFRFARGGFSLETAQAVFVGLAALVLFGALLLWMRRGGPSGADPEDLARQIATLDRAFEGREGHASPAERAVYQSRRRRLKERLEAALAAREPGP